MTFFLILGIKNSWRNTSRSLIAILSMAIAAAVLSYSISLGRGYASGVHGGLRAFVGGEISVYTTLFDVGGYDATHPVRYQKLKESPFTDLEVFHPELFQEGYLALQNHDASTGFDKRFISDLSSWATISDIVPKFQFPAIRLKDMSGFWPAGGMAAKEVKVVGRSFALDNKQHRHLEEFISKGRWFELSDESQPVCILFEHQQKLPNYPDVPSIGNTIKLLVPEIRNSNGSYVFDYDQPLEVELEVIGLLSISSRTIDWQGGSESLYWTFNDVLLPMSTWEQLWQLAGGGEYESQQLSMIVEDPAFVNDTLDAVRQSYPQYSFYSVVDQADRIIRTMEWETTPLRAPRDSYIVQEAGRGGDIQDDLRLPIVIALVSTASLVIAANLLIMVAERKKEIAVLKAVGARRLQIVVMVASEAVCISYLGGMLGFVFMQIPMLLNQIVASVSLIGIVSGMISNLFSVLGVSVVMTLVFSLIPARQMTKLTVMEVLRDE